ncbi:hypothetical protein [Spirillospora sp. NPDC029432]|uniref:hypothetical protein n=1 Tax=Spirillospora sp. NPDC029432 TaxID=3154599 RepID=UPI0034534623
MPYLSAAVVLIGVLCLVNLLLTFGVVRRLRQQGGEPHDHGGGDSARPRLLAPGRTVGDFAASTTEGRPFGRETFGDGTLVGVFMTGCWPCQDLLPEFAERARDAVGDPDRVVAVVATVDGEHAEDYVERLSGVARVLVERDGGPVLRAFEASSYPALYVVDAGGVVAAAGIRFADLDGALSRTASAP